MDDFPATVESDVKPTNVPSSVGNPVRVKSMRFTHPSGSRPLEGYTIKRGIGIGGFGEVYFALSDAGKEIALKRIQRNLDVELRGVRQCLNLKHVNLIKLWDIKVSEAGESWVVMEYVPGDSLRDVVDQYPQGLPDDQVQFWFRSICAGVTYLHDRGIVHRDLKPGNIFHDDDEQVIKIGDYGLAKFISSSNRDGQTESVGTFHYMAPEIGKGVYGKEIDIYALGIILFEIVTGRVPFEGESSQEIIMKHLTADPDVSGVHPSYAEIIAKALAKDPERRFRSVPELIAALDGSPINDAASSKTGTSVNSTSTNAAIQPMFIGEEEIKFGEVKISSVPDQTNTARPKSSRSRSSRSAFDETTTRPARANKNIAPGTIATQVDVHIVSNGNEAVTADGAIGSGEEPIARAVKDQWHRVTDWWYNANLNLPVKVLILVAAVFVLLINSPVLLPVSIGLGLLYLIYFTVRTCFVPGETAKPKASRAEKTAQLRSALAKRPAADRFTETVGSLVVSSLVCLVLAFFTLLTTSVQSAEAASVTSTTAQPWAFYTWAVVVCVATTWMLLVSSKTWEHRKGDATLRRFAMLAMGVVAGLLAFAASSYLRLDWTSTSFSTEGWPILDSGIFVKEGAPQLLGFVIYFSGLFLILRWWRQADPVRRTRLSIWAVGLCLVWGVLVGQLVHFPLPWSGMLAVIISIATQISAAWLAPEQRSLIEQNRPNEFQSNSATN